MSDASIAKPVWTWQPERIAAALRERGYDVDASDARLDGGGGSLTARRDRAEAADLLVVDSGGRVRLRASKVDSEQARRDRVGDVLLRVVSQHRLTATVTGTVRSLDELAAVLDHLDATRADGSAETTPVG